MKIINAATELVPIDRVYPHPQNVNQGDQGAIFESITENGFFGSVVVQQSTGRILAGTHRWKAAKDAGATEIPATYVDVDDERALRIMLADNRTARLGMDDPAALAELLQEILKDTGTLTGTAFSADDLDEILAQLNPNPPEEPGLSEDQTDKLTEQYQVLITCNSEHHQSELLERLTGEGFECRALIS
jgi:ParB-like chromosome segregation protein Spo0J